MAHTDGNLRSPNFTTNEDEERQGLNLFASNISTDKSINILKDENFNMFDDRF